MKNYLKHYNCGYTLSNKDGVLILRDDVEGINRYELYSTAVDCFILYRLIHDILESDIILAGQKRWFFEQLDLIEMDVPGFVSDGNGTLLRLAVAKIFKKKKQISVADLRLYKFCKSDLMINSRGNYEHDIEMELMRRVNFYA